MHDHRLMTLVGCIRGIVLEFDGEARYLNAWADDARLLALPTDQLVGKTINEVLGEHVGDPFTDMVRRVHTTGTVEHLEYPLDLDGGRRWFLADIKRVSAPDTGMTVVFFARDITERRATEEALARSEERYRLAARATNDVLWDWDLASDTVTWNAAIQVALGYEHSSEHGAWWKDTIHPDDRAMVLGRLEQALASGASAWSDRYRRRRSDGTYRDFLDRGFIARDAAGCARRIVGSMTDVTQINQLQAQLIQADRLAALGTLAAGVGHEINNPLSYVLGNLDVALAMADANEELQEPLREARDGARRVAEIVKSLKMFTRGDDQEVRPIDIHQVIDAAIRMTDKELRHRARLVRELAPVAKVRGNESQLAQVFLNLLINAGQAIEAGNPEINEVRVTTAAVRGRIVVTIEDTGCGIAPDDLPRVFDPFYTTKPIGTGTGLGLSICHGILSKMGGEITVMSELGRGSTFTISLPAVADTIERRPRVLVIDDEVNIGRLVTRIYQKHAEVVAMTSARAALARLTAMERFDLILCDLMMPDMTGIELYEELRRTNPSVLRRVYFMSGGAFTPKAQDFLDSIGVACIDKPFDGPRLVHLLSTLH
jgi:PAS domain S-box-containing protein